METFWVQVFWRFCLITVLFVSVSIPVHVGAGEGAPESCELSGPSDATTAVCNLKTLNGSNLSARIGLSSPESVSELRLECSELLFYQSVLSSSSLTSFSKLSSLSIEHCKLSRLETGLFASVYLRNLTVNTHNTRWPALALDLSEGLFNSRTLVGLERLDLSQNNIWTFPPRVFCPLSSMVYLNLSLNRLQELGDLCFKADTEFECKTNLETLDVSHNRLILFPPSGLGALGALRTLHLHGNEISVVTPAAFRGLSQLRVLNLAQNKLTSIHDDGLFDACPELEEIYLQNNSLSALSPRLFSKLNQLVILDLSYNRLSSASAFGSGLIRLVVLNLSHNQLTAIDPDSFLHLYSLQILNLEHNQLKVIATRSFSSMNNLHTLVLSHNQLMTLDSSTLDGLFVLSQLSLDNNRLASIHRLAFQNCSSLRDLNLNGNALEIAVGGSIQNLTLLRTLDLGENQLTAVPRLHGLPNLYGLRLTGNRITNISRDTFRHLAALKILNLARNQLRTISEGAFDANTQLQALRLDANHLTDISNLFAQSPSLIWLNVSDNALNWFDYALIPSQLQWIDVHKNKIRELGNVAGENRGRETLRLQTLDASFNRITQLGPGNLPDSLEMVFLNDNLIKVIEPGTFAGKVNLTRVDIFANQIERLELESLRVNVSVSSLTSPSPEIYLAQNPLTCDCNSEWLQKVNDLKKSDYFKVIDLDSVYCRISHGSTLPVVQMTSSQFLCPYTDHCFNLCECCEYGACDCQQQCPLGCSCFHDSSWATNIVDCSFSARNHSHAQVPAQIPMDASHLYLDGNSALAELPSHGLIGRKNLQVLHLNHSGLVRLANNSLAGLRRLSVLHLDHNRLTRLQGHEFKDLTELRELYLEVNALQFIASDTFVTLAHLRILHLHQNKLTAFEMWSLTSNGNLIQIGLAFNEWSCDCGFLAHAVPWVQANVGKLLDASGLNCRMQERNVQFSLVYMSQNGSKCSDLMALSGEAEAAEASSVSSMLPSWVMTVPHGAAGLIAIIAVGVLALVVGGLMAAALCRLKGRRRRRGEGTRDLAPSPYSLEHKTAPPPYVYEPSRGVGVGQSLRRPNEYSSSGTIQRQLPRPPHVHQEPLNLAALGGNGGGIVLMNGQYHIVSESSSGTSTLNFTNTNSSVTSGSALPLLFGPPVRLAMTPRRLPALPPPQSPMQMYFHDDETVYQEPMT